MIKNSQKLGNNVVFPIFTTSSYNFNDATTYYCLLLQKTYTSKNAQILPSNQNQQKKIRLSGPIYEKLKKTTNRYYVHVWKSEEYLKEKKKYKKYITTYN